MKKRPLVLVCSLLLCAFLLITWNDHTQSDQVPEKVSDRGVDAHEVTSKKSAQFPGPLIDASAQNAVAEEIIPVHRRSNSKTIYNSEAISERILEDGSLEVILHSGSAEAPVRVRQILRKVADEEWQLAEQSKMAGNSFLVRKSDETLTVLLDASDDLSHKQVGQGNWILVQFEYDPQLDRLSRWLEFIESKGLVAEPNYQVRIAELFSDDPLFQNGQQPHLDGLAQVYEGTLNVAALWEAQTDISSAPVAILDTGIRSTHVEFSGQLWNNSDEIPNNEIDDDANGYVDDVYGYDFVNPDSNPTDDHGHGTHLAGLVGARGDNDTGIAGVGWQASLMPIKVLNSSGNGYVSDVVEGIYYAIDNGASVMLLAFQMESESAALRSAFQEAQDADIIWSVPAGNGAKSLMEFPVYPAVYEFPNQITVGSHNLDAQYSIFSNYGIDYVDISAPGNDVLSAGSSSNTAYVRKTGTSQSSAFVAGVMAHLRTAFPGEAGWRSVQRLKDASDTRPRSNLSRTSHRKDYVARGRLDCASPALLAATTAPDNDDLKNARTYESPEFVSYQILLDATAQAQEPSHGGSAPESSVWYRWTPRHDGAVTIEVDHPQASLAAYTWAGVLSTLQSVVESAPDANGASITFQASANTTYNIALNVPNGTSELVCLELNQMPSNGDFGAASVISEDLFGTSAEVKGFLTASGAEIWYRWTAPGDGSLRLNPRSDLTTQLLAYHILPDGSLGDLIDSLEVYEGEPNAGLSFNTVAEEPYAIRWSNLGNGNGYVTFGGTYQAAPQHVGITLDRLNYIYSENDLSGPPPIPPENRDTVLYARETLLRPSLTGGSTPLTFKWYFNGNFVLEGRNLYIAKTLEHHAGEYVVEVSNPIGTVSSNVFELKVLTQAPKVRLSPQIIYQSAGDSASIYAEITNASGASNNVKWFLNGALVQDSSSRVLTLTNLTPSDTGVLRVLVTNQFGSAYSQEVIVKVTPNPLENWERILPDTPARNLSRAFFAGGRFFAKGSDTFYTSPDGENWNKAVFDTPLSSINGVAYGNGAYVAIGMANSKATIARSTDGVFWEIVHQELGSSSFSSIVFGNGKFVTHRTYPSPGTNFFTSTDGENWSSSKYSSDALFTPIHFGNGIFLISKFGTHFTSSDGVNWLANAVPSAGPTRTGSLTFHDGYFYKLSGSSSSSMGLYKSADGVNWEVISGPDRIGVYDDDDGLYYDGEYFIVPRSFGPYISNTGTGFTRYTGNLTGSTTQGWLHDFAVGDGRIVGVEENGRIMSGVDVTDLTFDDRLFTKDFFRLEALDDVLVAMGTGSGYSYGNGYAWSYDGITWNTSEALAITDITKWDQRYVAVASGALKYSYDLLNWESMGLGAELVANGNNRLVRAFGDGRVSSSLDGINWSSPVEPAGVVDTPEILRFVNGEFWLAGSNALYRSADGITWSTSNLADVRDITYAHGKYVAGYGPNWTLYTSNDGNSWTAEFPAGGTIRASRLKTNQSVVLGANFSDLLYSDDSENWTQISIEQSSTDIAFFNGGIFYTGDDGLIYRHGDVLSGPEIEADLDAFLADNTLYVGHAIDIPYELTSIAESVQITLFVDGNPVDSVSDGSLLRWIPDSPSIHQIWMEAVDSNGLKQRTAIIEVNVRQGTARIASDPTTMKFIALHASSERVWIGTEAGGLYTRQAGTSDWQLLELPPIDRIIGMEGDNFGGKYLFGSVYSPFGGERGVVLFSQDGIYWELYGSLLEFPVIDILSLGEFTFALVQDSSDTTSSAPSQLYLKPDDGDWALASQKETLRSLVKWEGRIYAKDYSGVIQVSEDGIDWVEELNTNPFDSRDSELLAADDALLLVNRSRIYHNRVNGNSWGYDYNYNLAAVVDGLVYIQTNAGVHRLMADGTLVPNDRFSTLSTGQLEEIIKTVSLGEEVYWLTSNGRLLVSSGDRPEGTLDKTSFSGQNVRLIKGIPFRANASGEFSVVESSYIWTSATLKAEAEANNMKSFAYGAGTALFVGDDGAYRHNSLDDSWSLLPNTQDMDSVAFSEGRFWLLGFDDAAYSDDAGTTWTSFYADLDALTGGLLRGQNISAQGDWIVINRVGNFLYSPDRGLTWSDSGFRADKIAFTENELIICGGTYDERLRYVQKDDSSSTSLESLPFNYSADYFDSFSSWGVRDYMLNAGIEYVALSSPWELSILARQPGGIWQMVLHPTPVSSTKAIFYKDNNKTFLATDDVVYETTLQNIKVSIDISGVENLGVGESSMIQIEFNNTGYGTSPVRTNISVAAMLQPEGTASLGDSVQIGEALVDLPELAEGESEIIPMTWRIPEGVEPGSYYVRIAATGLRDSFGGDNIATTDAVSIVIPSRTINLEARGSGQGTIINLDPRETYPDQFALPLIITPNVGYVYSAGPVGNGSANAASITTVVLDGSFDGKIYFEPSYETWASSEISSPSERARDDVTGHGSTPNVFKYLLGIEAVAPHSGSAFDILEDSETAQKLIQFRVVHGREGEPFSLNASSDLEGWSPLDLDVNNEGDWLLFESTVPESYSDQGFFRLETP